MDIKPNQLNSRDDLAQFIKDMHSDFRTNGREWENQDLESFLEALAAYAKDIDGYYKNENIPEDPDKPSWRLFSDMLYGARMYE
jgi:hypothetical protein